jgi:hypothetical protein
MEKIPFGNSFKGKSQFAKKELTPFMKRCKSILKNYMFKEFSKDFTIDLLYDGFFTM